MIQQDPFELGGDVDKVPNGTDTGSTPSETVTMTPDLNRAPSNWRQCC
jgi:hypothetical protein